jgi:hypothetical protein
MAIGLYRPVTPLSPQHWDFEHEFVQPYVDQVNSYFTSEAMSGRHTDYQAWIDQAGVTVKVFAQSIGIIDPGILGFLDNVGSAAEKQLLAVLKTAIGKDLAVVFGIALDMSVAHVQVTVPTVVQSDPIPVILRCNRYAF